MCSLGPGPGVVRFVVPACSVRFCLLLVCVCVFVFVFAFGLGLGQSPLYHILVLYTCQESADRSKYRHVYHRDYDKHSTGFVFRHSSQDPVAELFN